MDYFYRHKLNEHYATKLPKSKSKKKNKKVVKGFWVVNFLKSIFL